MSRCCEDRLYPGECGTEIWRVDSVTGSFSGMWRQIVHKTGAETNMSFEVLVGRNHTKPVVRARAVAIRVMRDVASMSTLQIGKVLNRDHKSIHASLNWSKGAIRYPEHDTHNTKEKIEKVKAELLDPHYVCSVHLGSHLGVSSVRPNTIWEVRRDKT